MDRRSFITSLVGGLAAASLGGITVAAAAPSEAGLSPAAPDADAALAPGKAEALDRVDADYTRHHHRRGRYHRRHHRYHRRYYRRHHRGWGHRARRHSQR